MLAVLLVCSPLLGIAIVLARAVREQWREPVEPFVPPLRSTSYDGGRPGREPRRRPGPGDPSGDRVPRVPSRPSGAGAIALPVPIDESDVT